MSCREMYEQAASLPVAITYASLRAQNHLLYRAACLQMNRKQRPSAYGTALFMGRTVGEALEVGKPIHCGLVEGALGAILVHAACVKSAESVCAKQARVPSLVHRGAVIGYTATSQSAPPARWRGANHVHPRRARRAEKLKCLSTFRSSSPPAKFRRGRWEFSVAWPAYCDNNHQPTKISRRPVDFLSHVHQQPPPHHTKCLPPSSLHPTRP